MTSKGFGEYTHPVTIRNYDDTVLRDIPPVEAILYIITNVTNGMKYIGSHKLKVFGQWLDGYYQSSSDDDFQLLFWGLQENIFDYKIFVHEEKEIEKFISKILKRTVWLDNQSCSIYHKKIFALLQLMIDEYLHKKEQ